MTVVVSLLDFVGQYDAISEWFRRKEAVSRVSKLTCVMLCLLLLLSEWMSVSQYSFLNSVKKIILQKSDFLMRRLPFDVCGVTFG